MSLPDIEIVSLEIEESPRFLYGIKSFWNYLQAAASAADLFDSMIGCFDGFWLEMGGLDWKWGVWCIPIRSSVWCSPAGFFFSWKKMTFVTKHYFSWFSNDFSLKWTWFAIKSMNHEWKWHPGPYRILMGTLNAWNGPMTRFDGKLVM